MAKAKKHCAKVASNVCASNLVAATIGLEKSCEGKQAILPRLLAELRKDVRAGRMSAQHADSTFKARMRGVEGTCRLQNVRFERAEVARKAAETAAKEKNLRTMNPYGAAYSRADARPVNGLLGLGLFGIL